MTTGKILSSLAIFASLLALATASEPSLAQDATTADGIVKQLARKPLTRSMAPTRRIEVVPGKQSEVLEETKDLPSVSIRVLFGYDSDALTPEGRTSLAPLGTALKDPRLASQRMLVAGHTDAMGSDYYNQDLSERRARSVREYLVASYGIDPQRLVSMGFGFRKLADTANPTSPANRRVEIVNLGQQ